jgi:hypothetical protein
MRVVWEDEDIKGGRLAENSNKSRLLIGYREKDRQGSKNSMALDTRWMLISMDDGLAVISACTRGAVAEWLTDHDYLPTELT